DRERARARLEDHGWRAASRANHMNLASPDIDEAARRGTDINRLRKKWGGRAERDERSNWKLHWTSRGDATLRPGKCAGSRRDPCRRNDPFSSRGLTDSQPSERH